MTNKINVNILCFFCALFFVSDVSCSAQQAAAGYIETPEEDDTAKASSQISNNTYLLLDRDQVAQKHDGTFDHGDLTILIKDTDFSDRAKGIVKFSIQDTFAQFDEDLTAPVSESFSAFPCAPYSPDRYGSFYKFRDQIRAQLRQQAISIDQFLKWNDQERIKFPFGDGIAPKVIAKAPLAVSRIRTEPCVVHDWRKHTTWLGLHYCVKGLRSLLAYKIFEYRHTRQKSVVKKRRGLIDQNGDFRQAYTVTYTKAPDQLSEIAPEGSDLYTRLNQTYDETEYGDAAGLLLDKPSLTGRVKYALVNRKQSSHIYVSDNGEFFLTTTSDIEYRKSRLDKKTNEIVRRTNIPFVGQDQFQSDVPFSRGFYKPSDSSALHAKWVNPQIDSSPVSFVTSAGAGAPPKPFTEINIRNTLLAEDFNAPEIASKILLFNPKSKAGNYIQRAHVGLAEKDLEDQQRVSANLIALMAALKTKLMAALKTNTKYKGIAFTVDELVFADDFTVAHDVLTFMSTNNIPKLTCSQLEIDATNCDQDLDFMCSITGLEPKHIVLKPGCDLSKSWVGAAGGAAKTNLARLTQLLTGNTQLETVTLSDVTLPSGATAFNELQPFFNGLAAKATLTELHLNWYTASYVNNVATTQTLMRKFRSVRAIDFSAHDFQDSLDLYHALMKNRETLIDLNLSNTRGMSRELGYMLGNSSKEHTDPALYNLNQLRTLNLKNADIYQPLLCRCLQNLPASLETLTLEVKNSYGWIEDHGKLTYLYRCDAEYGNGSTAKALGRSTFSVVSAPVLAVTDTLVIGSSKLVSSVASHKFEARPYVSTSRYYDWTFEDLVENASISQLYVFVSDSLLNPTVEQKFLEDSFASRWPERDPINISVAHS